MAGPLTNVRVLEMANFISGPYCGMLLADLGADVVKVEQPGAGDPFRGWSEREGDLLPQFAAYNRGKRGITLNVQAEGGKEAYRRLAARSDVVIENFRPGTAERLGIGFEALRENNPGLIYCAITGMGSTGPYKNRPTYDAIGQAMSGLWSVFTDLANPKPVGPAMCDQLTGLYAAYGILAALAGRPKDGGGQRLEVSMLSAAMAFMTNGIADYTLTGEIPDQDSRPRRSQSYAFVAGDGLPLAIHLSSPPKFWLGLTRAVGRPELAEDSRFRGKGDRIAHYDVLHDLLADIFRTRSRADWLAVLEEHDVPCAPINTVAEAVADPQAQHIGMLQTFGSGDRAVQLVGFPVAFPEAPCQPGNAPPRLGEHTEAVLQELGYSDEERARLQSEG